MLENELTTYYLLFSKLWYNPISNLNSERECNLMKKYYGIDWIRAVACIGIMMMHVLANNTYEISGFVYNSLIPSFTDFVYLFMAVSAFGMCHGYFNKVMSGEVNWTTFYKKRYSKTLPFFLLLIVIDLVLNWSINSLCEAITEVTMLHGLVPYSFSVVGVGWFLGTVFVFYLVFPFFCVLIESKFRAWCAFAVSIALNYICSVYFGVSRINFIYSLCFFLGGGLVFLYKETLEKIKWYFYLPVITLSGALYFFIGANTLTRLLVTMALLSFTISINCRKVRVISLISNISMEFYLSHMFVFRVIEKLHLNTLCGNGWLQFLVTVFLVFVGTMAFSLCFQTLINKTQAILNRKGNKPL